MRRHLRNPWVWVVAALLFAGWLLWPRAVKSPTLESTPPPAAAAPAAPAVARVSESGDATALASLPAFLPGEARDTILRIARGGPFPHRQDGAVFGNREGHLPTKPRGYYREYTVDTPGVGHRGARRIVTGGSPPVVWYYTDDHYDSFRSFDVGALDVSNAGSGR